MNYKKIQYFMASDPLVYKDTPRCTRPQYDKKDGRTLYVLEQLSNIPPPSPQARSFLCRKEYTTNERWVSPMVKDYRAPFLPEMYWMDQEDVQNQLNIQTGTRIQIYSIIDVRNIKTRYIIERLSHPMKRWKHIIITYHISEDLPFLPHIINELTMRY